MDFFINLYAKAQGITALLIEWLPVVGAAGSILGVASSILVRAGTSNDPAGFIHAIHPTGDEAAAFALSVAVIKAHLNHQANAAKLEDHGQALSKSVPPTNPGA